jgi:hypothetical protein
MSRLLKLLGLSGILVAGLLYSFWYLYDAGKLGPRNPALSRSLQHITLMLWPSSIMMTATEGATTRLLVTAVGISLVLNGLIYMAIGYIAVKLLRVIR